ncbi:MAG TPA: hypothetical protein DCG75_05810 [Bacteroidales bacterium]|jgi:outer membrane protein|nr:hypothetical protein [Bacteroidales bacterium]
MRKRYLIIISIALLISNQVKSQSDKWTLNKCIEYAYENNIQIKQNELSNKINLLEINQLKANRIPSLNANDNQNFNWGNDTYNTNTFSINSSITIFNGLQNNHLIKQSKLNYTAGEYNIKQTKNNISLSVANAYLEIIFYNEQIKISKNQLESTLQQLKNTKNKVDAGMLPISNYLQLEAQLYSEELTVTNTENQLRIAKLNLMQLMEIEINNNFDIDIPEIKIEDQYKNLNLSIQTIYQTALNVRPEIQNAILNNQSTELGIKIAKASQLPKLTLNAGVGTQFSSLSKQISYGNIESVTVGYLESNPSEYVLQDQTSLYYNSYPFFDQYSDNLYENISFSLSVPIFNHFETKTSIEKSKINFYNSQLDLLNTKNNLRKNIEQAYTDLLAAKKEYDSNIKLLESYQRSYDDATKKFNAGMLSSVDFLIEKTKLINAENSLLQSKYNLIFKNIILDHYQGNPITI